MKEGYEKPKAEVILFDKEDMVLEIRCSGIGTGNSSQNTLDLR